jgi:hypothetical protein
VLQLSSLFSKAGCGPQQLIRAPLAAVVHTLSTSVWLVNRKPCVGRKEQGVSVTLPSTLAERVLPRANTAYPKHIAMLRSCVSTAARSSCSFVERSRPSAPRQMGPFRFARTYIRCQVRVHSYDYCFVVVSVSPQCTAVGGMRCLHQDLPDTPSATGTTRLQAQKRIAGARARQGRRLCQLLCGGDNALHKANHHFQP